ncbi:MAG: glutamate decarboxylase [Pseudomonadota bacterium]
MALKKMDFHSIDESIMPIYGRRSLKKPIPKYIIPDTELSARVAYDLVHDQLMLDGNARLNLASFLTTWMEPEAKQLMAETFDKNMIDKDEYPQTAEIEHRCVIMLANLWNAPDLTKAIGCSTIGSSEACMLAGMAFKWQWRKRRQVKNKSTTKPNLVMGINVQICWEKFCRYWDIEMRLAPMATNDYTLTASKMHDLCDENTIGVIAILGSTFTGEYEPIQAIHAELMKINQAHDWDIPMHIDGASGAMVAPFIQANLLWDFRLPLVKSINTSGHKYGLVYPGVGWVVWRDEIELPKELILNVNYLGGEMPTFALNFSRPGNAVVGQYYNFLRLGKDGYRRIHLACREVAIHLAEELRKIGPFKILHGGKDLPVVSWQIQPDSKLNYDVFDLSERLRMQGWQVPAYTLPANLENVAIMRIVVKEGLSLELADLLLNDIKRALDYFDKRAEHLPQDKHENSGFHH